MEALGISLPGLITQIVSFTILFVILYVLLYKPVVRMLDQRSTRIRESLEAAQKAQEDAASSQQAMQTQIQEARAEGQQMIAQAREVADRFRERKVFRRQGVDLPANSQHQRLKALQVGNTVAKRRNSQRQMSRDGLERSFFFIHRYGSGYSGV